MKTLENNEAAYVSDWQQALAGEPHKEGSVLSAIIFSAIVCAAAYFTSGCVKHVELWGMKADFSGIDLSVGINGIDTVDNRRGIAPDAQVSTKAFEKKEARY